MLALWLNSRTRGGEKPRAKASPDDANDSSCQLLFPIYYINGELIGVRRIYMTSDTKELKEETISTEKNHDFTLNTFPHRLCQVHKSKATIHLTLKNIDLFRSL